MTLKVREGERTREVTETLQEQAVRASAHEHAGLPGVPPIRVQVVDPPAWTPPYDHALCTSLARAGAEVELVTTEFPFAAPTARGYRVTKRFYRRSSRLYDWGDHRGALGALRRGVKLAEHLPDLLAHRHNAGAADILHYQWLTFPAVDVHLLPTDPPRVFTAHNVPPREPRPGELRAFRKLLREMDAVIVHSRHGARRLVEELDAPPERVHVIPHGAFDYLTRLPVEDPLPPKLAAVEGPVVLFFGLLRAYKGLDVLIDAFAGVDGAELWVVGLPHMPIEELEARARRAGARVRFVPRFVAETEIPAFFRRADIVALPYREIDQSGVLQTALAFGKPLVVTRVGGFVDIGEELGAARLVAPGDAGDLRAAITDLLSDDSAREELALAASAAAGGDLSWDSVAARTLSLYSTVLGR